MNYELNNALLTFVNMLSQMAPYLLLGFLMAGVLHVFVPKNFFERYLSKENFKSVLLAGLIGIPLPLCSCGVIPTAISLRKDGASRGATVAFMISTPQIGVDSIIATYSMMGLPFAIVRPLVAFGFMLFVLLSTPCFATIAAVRREAGWKGVVFTVFYNTGVAWIVSFLVYQIGSFF